MTDGTQTHLKLPGETHTKQLGLHKTDKHTTHSTSLIQYLGFIAFLAARLRRKAANGSRGDERYQTRYFPVENVRNCR